MNTLLETIESWMPCAIYDWYLDIDNITPQMTIREFLYSNNISGVDKEWGFARLLERFWVNIDGHIVTLHMCGGVEFKYDYETFLSMIDTFMDSQEMMEEEDV